MAIVLSKKEQEYLQTLEDLNKPRGEGVDVGLKTRLHPGQIEVLNDLIRGTMKTIFCPSGRKFGKSELAVYFLYYYALMYPNSACYYIAPEASHGRKIIWDTNRIQNFLGTDTNKYCLEPKNQEMKMPFRNGSFIQVIGSENFASANGLTPRAIVYDEFKAFHPKWHTEFSPNRAAKAAPMLIIGTQPAPGDRNLEQYNEVMKYCVDKDPTARVIVKTTFDNPINLIPERKRFIDQEIKQLEDRGEKDVVLREYYSIIVPGGKRAIFPMFSRDLHVKKHQDVLNHISRDIKKLDWHCVADPGSATVFGNLIVAMNPWNKRVYILDELYETSRAETSTSKIYPRLFSQMQTYYPNSSIEDHWFKTYDEAAAWFSVECMDRFGVYFAPTQKQKTNTQDGLSLIKDQLAHNIVVISDKCVNLIKEIENYAVTDKGDLPRHGDHLIDCWRYFNQASNYSMQEVFEAIKHQDPISAQRFRSPEQDEDLFRDKGDWTDVDFDS